VDEALARATRKRQAAEGVLKAGLYKLKSVEPKLESAWF
jgi:hypothetical protein